METKEGVILDQNGNQLTPNPERPHFRYDGSSRHGTYVRTWRSWKSWLALGLGTVLLPFLFFAGFAVMGLVLGSLLVIFILRSFFRALLGGGPSKSSTTSRVFVIRR